MQLDAPAGRTRLIGAGVAQAFTLGQTGVIQRGAVGNTQHLLFLGHTLSGTPLMGSENRLHRHGIKGRPVNQPVIALDGRHIALRYRSEGPPRLHGQM